MTQTALAGLSIGRNPAEASRRVSIADDPALTTIPPAVKEIKPGFVTGSLVCGLLMDQTQAGLHDVIYEWAAMQFRLYSALAYRGAHTIEKMVVVFGSDDRGLSCYCAALDPQQLGTDGYNHESVARFISQYNPIGVMFLNTVVAPSLVPGQTIFRCALELVTSAVHAQSTATINVADANRVAVENQLRPRQQLANDPYFMIPYIPVQNLDDFDEAFEEEAAPEGMPNVPAGVGTDGISMARNAFGAGFNPTTDDEAADIPPGVGAGPAQVPGVAPSEGAGVPGVAGSAPANPTPATMPQLGGIVAEMSRTAQSSTIPVPQPVLQSAPPASAPVQPVASAPAQPQARQPAIEVGDNRSRQPRLDVSPQLVATAAAVAAGAAPDQVPPPAEKKRPMLKSKMPFVGQESGTQQAKVVPIQSEDPRQYAPNLPRGMRPGVGGIHEAQVTPLGPSAPGHMGGVSTHQPPIVPVGQGHRTTPGQMVPGTGVVRMAQVVAVPGSAQAGGQARLDHTGQVQAGGQQMLTPQQVRQQQQQQAAVAAAQQQGVLPGQMPHSVQAGQVPAGGLHPEQKPQAHP